MRENMKVGKFDDVCQAAIILRFWPSYYDFDKVLGCFRTGKIVLDGEKLYYDFARPETLKCIFLQSNCFQTYS